MIVHVSSRDCLVQPLVENGVCIYFLLADLNIFSPNKSTKLPKLTSQSPAWWLMWASEYKGKSLDIVAVSIFSTVEHVKNRVALSLRGLSVGYSSWLQAPFVHPDFLITPTQLTVWLRLYTCLRTKTILGTFLSPMDNTSTALSRTCIIDDIGRKTFLGKAAEKSHYLVGENVLPHRTKGDNIYFAGGKFWKWKSWVCERETGSMLSCSYLDFHGIWCSWV